MKPRPEQTRTSGVDADWNVRGCVRRGNGGGKERHEQGVVEREDKQDKSQEEGGEGEAERADKRRRELKRERQGKHRTRAGASGGTEAPDGNVRGRGCKGEGAMAARNGKAITHKRKEREREQKEKESG